MLVSTKGKGNGGAVIRSSSPGEPRSKVTTVIVGVLTSVRLTLWLIAILTIAMAIATFIPQNGPNELYLERFGTALGPLIIKTTLRNLFGSWWFLLCFGLLAVNLLTCALHRSSQLARQEREWPATVSRADIETRARRERWRVAQEAGSAAQAMASRLQTLGYTVMVVGGDEKGSSGVVARRGRWRAWAPVIVHLGMVVVLLGAAWGRHPSNAFHNAVSIGAGDTEPVNVKGDVFSLHLRDAGTKLDAHGKPSDYWANVEVVEEGTTVKGTMIKPNAPLHYHGVNMTLNSVLPGGYGIEIKRGTEDVFAPIVTDDMGLINIQASSAVVHGDPHWIVAIAGLREKDEHGHSNPAALVEVGEMTQAGHNFQEIGWVGLDGVEKDGARFILVERSNGAVISLDKDIGVPIVFVGFLAATLGTLFLLSAPRRTVTALFTSRGKGAHVSIGANHARTKEAEFLFEQLAAELEATRDQEAPPPRIEESV